VLDPSSYVLTPQAHLTGGFAFDTWFGDNTHAGDFVFTIGGYHPAFKKPDWYPSEPRVGIDWKVSDEVSIAGAAYFAITPAAMMAGSQLAVTFESGDLKAWLKASADVLLYWKPFHFEAEISITVGVSYHIHFLSVNTTLDIELGASLSLWGPPTGGKVRVEWFIISFTVGFGDDNKGDDKVIDWEQFKSLLPHKPPTRSTGRRERLSAPPPTPAYLHINVGEGLLETVTIDGVTHWLVRPGDFTFTTNAAIPATTAVVIEDNDGHSKQFTGPAVGMQRLKNTDGKGGISKADYQSTQTIAIVRIPDGHQKDLKNCLLGPNDCTVRPAACHDPFAVLTGWSKEPVENGVPSAVWGDGSSALSSDPAGAVVKALTGVRLFPNLPDPSGSPDLTIDKVFADEVINPGNEDLLPLTPTAVAPGVPPAIADSFVDIRNIEDREHVTNRAAIFELLAGLGIDCGQNGSLAKTAADPGRAFADEPLEGVVAA
jgi:Family of unknown function (DUF6603)